jgi:UDP-N-acetylglucosamine--N-acetylmuramyl-(pentapeptide) pyrophosphoryl-undecaprenol N-acetylglucosamine transferase
LLVPYPHATADHQTRNALRLAATGAARVVPDAELDGPRLARELQAALDPAALAALRAGARRSGGGDARAAIAERVAALLATRGKRVARTNERRP